MMKRAHEVGCESCPWLPDDVCNLVVGLLRAVDHLSLALVDTNWRRLVAAHAKQRGRLFFTVWLTNLDDYDTETICRPFMCAIQSLEVIHSTPPLRFRLRLRNALTPHGIGLESSIVLFSAASRRIQTVAPHGQWPLEVKHARLPSLCWEKDAPDHFGRQIAMLRVLNESGFPRRATMRVVEDIEEV